MILNSNNGAEFTGNIVVTVTETSGIDRRLSLSYYLTAKVTIIKKIRGKCSD